MRKIITSTTMIILGMIVASLSCFAQNEKLPFIKMADKEGMFHANADGTPLYGSKKKIIRFKFIGDFQIVFGDTLALVKNFDNLYFHIKPNGKPAYSQKYNSLSEYTEDGFAIAENDLGFFHIKKDGKKPQNEKIYVKVRPFHNGLSAVENEDGDCFFIDTLGNPISKKKYLNCGDFKEKITWVQDNEDEKFILINKLEIAIIENRYTSITDADTNGKFLAKNDSTTFLITIKDDETVEMLVVPKKKKK